MSVSAPAIHRAKDRINPRARALTQTFDRDRLNLVGRDGVATAAFAMLDKVQQEAPELAYASIAVLFAVMSERLGVDPQDGHALGTKLLRPSAFHQKGNAQMDAMDDLAKQEWMGREVGTYRD
jgi:hypothetical protein